MADCFEMNSDCTVDKSFKEAVCIDAQRIYDSCSDKECLEDLRVYFNPQMQSLVDKATNVRIRDVSVISSYLNLESVAFHKGFYSIDITFFFEITLDLFGAPMSPPVTVTGLSVFNKNVVLYGSEGNVKIFSSDFSHDDYEGANTITKNIPKATVQIADPIALSAKICERQSCYDQCCRVPECICRRYGGELNMSDCSKAIYATIGIFYIVQIQRNVQILIPTYDFCIPKKECTTSDNPCELFSRIDFPTNEFFPPKIKGHDCSCSVSHSNNCIDSNFCGHSKDLL